MYLLLDREGANAKMYYFRYEYNTASEKLLIFLFAIQLIKVPYQIYMSYLQGIGYEKLVFIVLQPERLQQVLECLYAVHYGNYQGYMR